MIVAITAKQWTALLDALELSAPVAAVERELQVSFEKDEGLRFVHRDALFPLFEQAIAQLTLAQVQSRLDAAGACWAPYRTLRSAIETDPRLAQGSPLFTEVDHPSGVRYAAPGAAATLGTATREPASRAPRLGEHTDQVLAELLSLTGNEIATLHDAGIVAGPGR
jgi:2-methylfumaryl-CoA isomerase